VIYITGQIPDPEMTGSGKAIDISEQLQDDVKFAELVGTTIASLRQSRRLQRRQAAMRNFFAPVVMQALATGDSDQVLQPREADLTVMFCDLRGFSRRSEQDSQKLLQLLSDVSDALGVMTKHILGFDGVIGDFHGDAAMGFWGWPLAQQQSILHAARAAISIRSEYHQSDLGFRCGIGIAHGRAVAGQIGTKDQVKVTAFGPVVNLSSRLESMTKRFGAEIIIDSATREALLASEEAGETIRIRRLAKVRPAGFTTPFEIAELIPRSAEGQNQVSDSLIEDYEAALDLFSKDELDAALKQLRSLPTWDGPSQLLIKHILSDNRHGDVIELAK
jgi:adenylate cyclase